MGGREGGEAGGAGVGGTVPWPREEEDGGALEAAARV
jgi:hypothetical protein